MPRTSTGVRWKMSFRPECGPSRILSNVSIKDRGEHVAETLLEFRATGRVVHFDALAFATDQTGFTQDFKMLGRPHGNGLRRDLDPMRQKFVFTPEQISAIETR